VTIPVKKKKKKRERNPVSFFGDRFWGRRPDCVAAINGALQIVYNIEFECSTATDKGLLDVKEANSGTPDCFDVL